MVCAYHHGSAVKTHQEERCAKVPQCQVARILRGQNAKAMKITPSLSDLKKINGALHLTVLNADGAGQQKVERDTHEEN